MTFSGLSWHPGGKYLLSASDDKTLRKASFSPHPDMKSQSSNILYKKTIAVSSDTELHDVGTKWPSCICFLHYFLRRILTSRIYLYSMVYPYPEVSPYSTIVPAIATLFVQCCGAETTCFGSCSNFQKVSAPAPTSAL